MVSIIVAGLGASGMAFGGAPPQETQLRRAFAQARAGSFSEAERTPLAGNPLLPWLDAIQFRQGIAQNDSPQALIAASPGTASSDWLAGQWRAELIKRQDWKAAAAWSTRHPDDGADTRCATLLAAEAPARDTAWRQNALALWVNESKAPGHCTLLFDALKQDGALGNAQAWQRFDRLLADDALERLPEAIAQLAPADAALAGQYRGFLANPQVPAGASWPQDARTRAVLQKGLVALARKDPARAESALAAAHGRYPLLPEQRNAVLSEIALRSLVDYLPEAESRYAAVPESARSANLREWYLRNAFTRNDDPRTLAAFAQLLPTQRQEPRWRYFQARVLERGGRTAEAQALYRQAAQAAGYHGWLAADRLGADYAFCPLQPTLPADKRAALARNPSLQRALWLWQLGEANYAIWEWNAVFRTFDPEQQRQAVAMAQDIGWYDRAVFSLEAGDQNQRQYRLRFAAPYETAFREAAARFGLDRSWLIAHARAESIFMPGVSSSANARGLLQLLPSTAEAIAARNGIAWQGADALYRPELNILLGAGALRDVIDTYGGKAYLAIGAYNAGPGAVNRWLAARAGLDPDFWIETVPYKETREYIPRVLAFSVIYDWRLQQPVRPISQRLLGDFSTPAKAVAMRCPAPATAAPDAAKPRKRG